MFFLYFLYSFMLTIITAQDPIVNLRQGRIVGIKVYMENSVNPIEIFFGIPYAMAPIGRLRFSPPERHTGWRRTFFAHRMPPRCPQPGSNGTDFSEDCLFLNIWTTTRADGKLKPVLVILYSDSWSYGGIHLPCQEVAAEDIVVVTVAYRLHVLSFFTLKSTAARGNLALLDQYLALVWIRENIAAFGGDPASVTLAGHSAGANSVLYHILSPRPVGLFHRAIVMSPRDAWKIIAKDVNLNTTQEEKSWRNVAKLLGCSNNLDREVLQCMRARPLADIINLNSEVIIPDYLQPIADDFLPETEQYLPKPIANMLSSSLLNIHLDILLGSTDLESINFMGGKYNDLMQQNAKSVYEYASTRMIPELFKILSFGRPDSLLTVDIKSLKHYKMTQAISWEYWGSNVIKPKNNLYEVIESVAKMESGAKWSVGEHILAAKLASQVSRLYVYRYSQPSSVDLTGSYFNFTGAVHGTDLISLLGDPLMLQVARRPASDKEKKISSIFRRYIVNFVKFGSPFTQSEWPRYVLAEPNVHEICLFDDTQCPRSIDKEVYFWMQYLPQLISTTSTSEQSEKFKIGEDEYRFRGGVFAMCGVSVALLMLLFASVILLRKGKTYRASIKEDSTHL